MQETGNDLAEPEELIFDEPPVLRVLRLAVDGDVRLTVACSLSRQLDVVGVDEPSRAAGHGEHPAEPHHEDRAGIRFQEQAALEIADVARTYVHERRAAPQAPARNFAHDPIGKDHEIFAQYVVGAPRVAALWLDRQRDSRTEGRRLPPDRRGGRTLPGPRTRKKAASAEACSALPSEGPVCRTYSCHCVDVVSEPPHFALDDLNLAEPDALVVHDPAVFGM